MQCSTVGALAFALVLAAPALADAQEQQEAVQVRVGDLNTSTDRGADHALHRIRRAAQDVCDAAPGLRELRSFEDRIAARACVRDAMSRAVGDLGDPAVSAKFNGSRLYAQTGDQS